MSKRSAAMIDAAQSIQDEELANGKNPTPPERKQPVPMDPTLRLAAKLDRLMATVPPSLHKWAIGFLTAKYLPEPNVKVLE